MKENSSLTRARNSISQSKEELVPFPKNIESLHGSVINTNAILDDSLEQMPCKIYK